MEEELANITETANIYEQQISEFKQIQQVRIELKLIKCLWDYIFIVQTSLDEWKTTVWKKIDVEGMDVECKKLIRELRRKLYCICEIPLNALPKEYFKRDTETALKRNCAVPFQCHFSAVSGCHPMYPECVAF